MTADTGVAVVGIGMVGLGRFEGESVASIAHRAVKAALEDAGLRREQIDGLFVHVGSPRGLDYDEVANLLALEVDFAMQPWAHGRFGATTIINAVMAIRCGLVDHALCVAAWRPPPARGGTREYPYFPEVYREGGGPHSETAHAGHVAPVGGAALAASAYFHKYAIAPERLAAVAVAQRRFAVDNPWALMRTPLSAEEYLAARYIAEPLRLFDCSVQSGVGAAMILTSDDRAADLRQPPVHVLGVQGIHAGPNEFIFGQPGLGVNQAEVFDYRPEGADQPVYRQAGISPSDVGTLHCYDGFSPQVLWTLERFGFCEPGDAAEWIQGGRIERGGELPVNTSGGHLSEGHSNGWGATVELVTQLRQQAESRQLPGIAIGQWATTLGDSILYGHERR